LKNSKNSGFGSMWNFARQNGLNLGESVSDVPLKMERGLKKVYSNCQDESTFRTKGTGGAGPSCNSLYRERRWSRPILVSRAHLTKRVIVPAAGLGDLRRRRVFSVERGRGKEGESIRKTRFSL